MKPKDIAVVARSVAAMGLAKNAQRCVRFVDELVERKLLCPDREVRQPKGVMALVKGAGEILDVRGIDIERLWFTYRDAHDGESIAKAMIQDARDGKHKTGETVNTQHRQARRPPPSKRSREKAEDTRLHRIVATVVASVSENTSLKTEGQRSTEIAREMVRLGVLKRDRKHDRFPKQIIGAAVSKLGFRRAGAEINYALLILEYEGNAPWAMEGIRSGKYATARSAYSAFKRRSRHASWKRPKVSVQASAEVMGDGESNGDGESKGVNVGERVVGVDPVSLMNAVLSTASLGIDEVSVAADENQDTEARELAKFAQKSIAIARTRATALLIRRAEATARVNRHKHRRAR